MRIKIEKPDHWTDEQWQAITERDQNLLVAAAAGSGKTSVLVERIIRFILDEERPVNVDELLVVTFTNAAAAEMRARIAQALQRALVEHPNSLHVRKQMLLLQRASITTLHSFCLGLVRQYAHQLELDPGFRIADPMEAELLRQDVLESLIEEWYERDEEVAEVADRWVDGQDDQPLLQILLRIYEFSRSHPMPELWLRECTRWYQEADSIPIDQLPFTPALVREIRLGLEQAAADLESAAAMADSPDGPVDYLDVLQADLERIRKAAAAADRGFEALYHEVTAIQFGTLPRVKEADPLLKEQVQAIRNACKERIRKIQSEYFAVTCEEALKDLKKMAPVLCKLADLVLQFEQAYSKEKRARAMVDFDDLEHLALQLLQDSEKTDGLQVVPSDIAKRLSDSYQEVLVDEYQDINQVQERILSLVSRDGADRPANRFMVGDVKQSIYRFRLAEPKLFLAKYHQYRAGSGGKRIDLAANFRSRRQVVDAVNYLFRQIMTESAGEIPYDQDAELIGRAKFPEDETTVLFAPELHLIDRNTDDGFDADERASAGDFESDAGESSAFGSSGALSAGLEGNEDPEGQAIQLDQRESSSAQLEARLIAARIQNWMNPGPNEQPLHVFDKRSGVMRPVSYRDIVILLRSTTGWASVMKEELRTAGIPVFVEQTDGFFDATEVNVMLSLLKVIDNPLQDIPLAGVLRSPIVGLTEEQLAEIRILYPKGPFYEAVKLFCEEQKEQKTGDTVWGQKLIRFWERLTFWRTAARQGSVAELIAKLYRETGYADFVKTLENGEQRSANLRALYDKAKQAESESHRGLYRFLRLVEKMQQTGSTPGEARTSLETEDTVRIMTIHKSKGLEFPVVFVAGLGKQFNQMDLRKTLLLHKECGMGSQIVIPELRLKYPSLAYLGIKQQMRRELLAEEMRVLYVALTRAREKLILVGSVKQLAQKMGVWSKAVHPVNGLSDASRLNAKGYLDWIVPALVRHPSAEPLRAAMEEYGASFQFENDLNEWRFSFWKASDLTDRTPSQLTDFEMLKQLAERSRPYQVNNPIWGGVIDYSLSWEYPFKELSRMPAKWSVSQFKQDGGEREDSRSEAVRLDPKGSSSETEAAIRKAAYRIKPAFLTDRESGSGSEGKRFSAAEIGTFTHTVLQHLDLSRPLDRSDLVKQIRQLVEGQFLTAEQAEAVHVGQLTAFFQSELGVLLRNSARVHRELPFTWAVPPGHLLASLEEENNGSNQLGGIHKSVWSGERVLLQGVIDCLAESADGTLTLIDYKTDYVSRITSDDDVKELKNRYAGQVKLYMKAIEALWKREVREAYLYFFSQNLAIKVEKAP